MVQGELPTIDTGGEISSRNVPSGTEGTKSKYVRDQSHGSKKPVYADSFTARYPHSLDDDRAVSRKKFRRGFWERGAEGAEDESLQATRPRRRTRRGGGESAAD